MKTYRFFFFLIIPVFLVSACTEVHTVHTIPATQNSGVDGEHLHIKVADQVISEGTVIIDEVVSEGPGLVAIYGQVCKGPGALAGYAAITAGVNRDVTITVDSTQVTEISYAVLHLDNSQAGVYEFPSADMPATVKGLRVSSAFTVIGQSLPEAITVPMSTPDVTTITVGDSCFDPPLVVLPAGSTVIWDQLGIIQHNLVAEDGSFQSTLLNKGDTFEYTFFQPGTYAYYCSLHGAPGGNGMAGTIIIQERSIP